ncbi:hypothetical protein RKD25_000547 [Streptomyces sp. SAI-124]
MRFSRMDRAEGDWGPPGGGLPPGDKLPCPGNADPADVGTYVFRQSRRARRKGAVNR